MSERRSGRLGAWGLAALAGLLLFIVPSAWLVGRGFSPWVALVEGLLAFPLLPLGWHLVAERRRRRAGKDGALTGGDRFWLRMLAVALVFVGPLLVFDRGGVWRGIKDHATWPARLVTGHALAPGPSGDRRMLEYVPADAEAIVWVRQVGDVAGGGGDSAEELILAWKPDAVVLIARVAKGASIDIDEAREALAEEAWLAGDGGVEVLRPADEIVIAVSKPWRAALEERADGAAGPAALIGLLAPGAAVAAAARPSTEIAGARIAWATATVRAEAETLVLEVTAESPRADLVRAKVRQSLSELRDRGPEACREPLGAIAEAAEIGGEGDRAHGRLTVGGEILMGLFGCGLQLAE